MAPLPSPRAIALREMRERNYEENQRRMREEQGKTVPVPVKKAAAKKPAAAKSKVKKKINRSRGKKT